MERLLRPFSTETNGDHFYTVMYVPTLVWYIAFRNICTSSSLFQDNKNRRTTKSFFFVCKNQFAFFRYLYMSREYLCSSIVGSIPISKRISGQPFCICWIPLNSYCCKRRFQFRNTNASSRYCRNQNHASSTVVKRNMKRHTWHWCPFHTSFSNQAT